MLRLPRKVTLQHHQMLRLPRKVTFQIHQIHPDIAPTTQNDSHDWSCSHMKHHLQCAEEQVSPSDVTKYRAGHAKIALQNRKGICWKRVKRHWHCGADSNMIGPWTGHLAPARSPRLLVQLWRQVLYWRLHHLALRLSTQISPNAAPATKSDTPTSPHTAPATRSDPVTWLNCYFTFTELLLHCHFTELYLTELLLYWTVTLLSRYFTELLLYRTVLDWAVTLLNCYFTELLLYWAVALLRCYFTEFLLYWAVTLLNCYFTELLLYWILCIFKSP